MGASARLQRQPRVRRRLKVRVGATQFFTVDVGAGGLCAELLRVLAPGTLVEGAVEVGTREAPFTGRVVWARAGDAHLGLRGRMGILFTCAPPGLLEHAGVRAA
jgi:hypothetical protein